MLEACTTSISLQLQLMCGHMGEGLTADMWRLDHKLDRARFPTMPMDHKKIIRDYFDNGNITITTSGHYSTRMMQACIQEIGSDRIQVSKVVQ